MVYAASFFCHRYITLSQFSLCSRYVPRSGFPYTRRSCPRTGLFQRRRAGEKDAVGRDQEIVVTGRGAGVPPSTVFCARRVRAMDSANTGTATTAAAVVVDADAAAAVLPSRRLLNLDFNQTLHFIGN